MKSKSAIILILLSIGLFYTFTNVEYKKVQTLHVQASEYQNVLANVSDIVRLRDDLLVTYEEFPQEDIERINKVLPENVDTVKLALELDNIASSYAITIKDLSMGDSTGEDMQALVSENSTPYEKATVSFSFISNYDNFKSLLLDMEKNLRLMDIKSISFKVDDKGLYLHQIVIETYWIK